MLGQPKSNVHKKVTSAVTKTVSLSQFRMYQGGFCSKIPPNDVITCNNSKSSIKQKTQHFSEFPISINMLFLLSGDAVVFPDNCFDYSARTEDRCYYPSVIHFDEIQFRALGEEPLVISYEFIEWIDHIPVQLNPTLEREGPLYVRI